MEAARLTSAWNFSDLAPVYLAPVYLAPVYLAPVYLTPCLIWRESRHSSQGAACLKGAFTKCERLVESRSFPLCLSKQTLATLARASRSRQLKAPVEAHEVLAGQVVDPTERIALLEIAQGYFQRADHIAAAALRATEPDSIPDAE